MIVFSGSPWICPIGSERVTWCPDKREKMETLSNYGPSENRFVKLKLQFTVLPTKSNSDVMFVYKVTRDLESIDQLFINPIRRINTQATFRFA